MQQISRVQIGFPIPPYLSLPPPFFLLMSFSSRQLINQQTRQTKFLERCQITHINLSGSFFYVYSWHLKVTQDWSKCTYETWNNIFKMCLTFITRLLQHPDAMIHWMFDRIDFGLGAVATESSSLSSSPSSLLLILNCLDGTNHVWLTYTQEVNIIQPETLIFVS